MNEPSQSELKESFGRRLRLARIAGGFKTAKDFADKLGMDQNSYSPYESKNYIPKQGMLWQIRQYLHVSMDYLFLGDEQSLNVTTYEKIKAVEERLAKSRQKNANG